MARMSIKEGFLRVALCKYWSIKQLLMLSGVLFLFLPTTSHAEYTWIKNNLKSNIPSIYIDYWSGLDNQQQPYACLFIELSPAEFQLVRHKDGYQAKYEIDISIWTEDRIRIKGKVLSDSVLTSSSGGEGGYNWNRMYRASFELPDGAYHAMIEFIDKSSNQSALLQQELIIQNEAAVAINLSDILLARRDQIETGPEENPEFGIIPYPSKLYGEAQQELYYYFEIYQDLASAGDSLDYVVQFIGDANEQVEVLRRRVASSETKIAVLQSLNVETFPSGDYQLSVSLQSQAVNYAMERSMRFTVYQNPIDLHYRTYEEILTELRLMASAEEFERLKSVPAEQQQAALNRFWLLRDPTPATEANELFLQFYERVYIARKEYSIGRGAERKIGDRGKIYVMLGMPDTISAANDGGASFSDTIVWKYNLQQMQVVFRDEIGSGNYRLVSPYSLLEDL